MKKPFTRFSQNTRKFKWANLFNPARPGAYSGQILSLTAGLILAFTVTGKAQIEVSLTTGSTFIIDNQGCNDPGPRSAYIGVEICNNTGAALNDLTAAIQLTTIVPGTDPFALAGGQAAEQIVGPGGTLADGACDVLYWLVTYPCDLPEKEMGIDIFKEVSIAVDVKQNGSSQAISGGPFAIQTMPNNSSNNGGEIVTQTLGAGVYLGQLLCMNVRYSFGNINVVGDILTLQPAGNADFNAGCFQLVNAEIIFTENSNGNPIHSLFRTDFSLSPGQSYHSTKDQIAFEIFHASQLDDFTSNGNLVEVKYYFKVNCLGGAFPASPYASNTAGQSGTYSSNFGQNPIQIPAGENYLSIQKSVSTNSLSLPFASAPEQLTYTVVITNNNPIPLGFTAADVAVSIDQITDILPGSFSYQALLGTDDATEVTAANSTLVPAANETGAITWIGGQTAPALPFPFSSYYIPGDGGTLTLAYQVNVPEEEGSFTNSATATVGSTSIGPATATVDIAFGCPEIGAISGPGTICRDNTTTLTATGLGNMSNTFGIRFVAFPFEQTDAAVIYDYANNGGASLDVVANGALEDGGTKATSTAIAYPTSETYYIYAILDPIPAEEDCRPFAATAVIVVDDPDISISADMEMLCEGTGAILTAGVSGGTGACQVNWLESSNGIDFSPTGVLGNIFTVSNTLTPGIYYYQAVYSCSGLGCEEAESEVMAITVFGRPGAAAAGDPQAVCGNMVTLAATAPLSGTGAWSEADGDGNGIFSNENAPDATFTGTPGVTYELQWTVSNGTCPSSQALVTISLEKAPSTAAAGGDQTVCGTTTTLTANTPAVGAGTWTEYSGDGNGDFSNANDPGATFTGAPGVTYTLQWTITNGSCAASSDEVIVDLLTLPGVTINGDPTACIGGTVTLNAEISNQPGVCSIEWRNAINDELLGTNNSLVISRNQVTTIPVKVVVTGCTGTSGCVTESEMTQVRFLADPTIGVIPANPMTCAGGTVTLTAVVSGTDSECSIQWINTLTQEVLGTGSSVDISSTTARTVSVQAIVLSCEDRSGCNAESEVREVVFTADPQIAITPSTAMACVGGEITLEAMVTGPKTDCEIEWRNAVTQAVLGTGNMLEVSSGLAQTIQVQAFVLSCANGDLSCTAVSNLAEVMFVNDPEIRITPENPMACLGGTVILQANLAGDKTDCNIEWYERGSNTPIGAGAQLQLSSEIAQSIWVTAVVTDCEGGPGCTAESNEVEVIFVPDPHITISGENIACAGGTVLLTAAIENPKGDNCNLQWQEKVGETWISLPNETNETLSIRRNTAGNYTFRVQLTACDGGAGCNATSANFVLTFAPDPTVTVSSLNNNACAGGTVTLNANISGGQGACNLQWQQQINGTWTSLNGETGLTLTVTQPNPAVLSYAYRVLVTACAGGSGCDAASAPYVVQFKEDPTVTVAGATSACVGGTLSLNASVVNPNGACNLQWQELTDNGWTDLNGQTGAQLNVSKAEDGQFSYRVRVISCDGGSGCDAVSAPYVLTFAKEPSLQLLPTTDHICAGEATSFTATVEGGLGCTSVKYLIKRAGAPNFTLVAAKPAGTALNLPGDLPNGYFLTPASYTIRAETECSIGSCFGADESTLVVQEKPALTNGLAALVCSDDASGVILSVQNPSAPNVVGVFYKINSIDQGGLIAAAGSPAAAVGIFSNDQVIADDAWTNTGTAAAVVTYQVTPVFQFGANEFCEGAAGTVKVTVRPKPALMTNLNTVKCSKEAAGLNLTVQNAGATDVTDTYFIIKSIQNNGLSSAAGTPQSDPDALRDADELADDAWINNGLTAVNVVYTIIPVFQYDLDDYCYGAEQTVTMTVLPAPVMNPVAPVTVCSPGEKLEGGSFGTGIVLSIDNDPATAGNQPPVYGNTNNRQIAFRLDAVQGTAGLTRGLGNAAVGSISDADLIRFDTWINPTANPVTVTYRITPIVIYNAGTEAESICYGDFQLVKVTVMPNPAVEVELQIVGVDYPTSRTCGQFDVIMDIEICNNGPVKIKNLDVDLNLAAMANGIFVGVVQRPVYVEGVNLNSDLRNDFNGNSITDIFDGSTAGLAPGACTKYRVRFEVAPDGTTQELASNALFKAGVLAEADWTGIPGGGFDGNTTCFAVSGLAEKILGDCWWQSRIMGADDLVNVTLDENCQALIIPDMILEGHKNACDVAGYPLGGFYRLIVVKPGNVMEGPFTDVILNAEDFNGGRAIVMVENVSGFCYPVWGELNLVDRTNPEFGPYEAMVTHVKVEKDVQKISGQVSGSDPKLRLRNYSCFVERTGLPNCDNPYKTINFKVDKTDVYTIELDITDADGMVALYQNGFNPAQPCSNVIGQNDVPLGGEGIYEPGDAAGRIRMVLPLDPEVTYTLLVAGTDCNDDADNFTVYIESDGDGRVVNTSAPVQAVKVKLRYPLWCTDVNQVLNQEASTLFIPGPQVLSDCTPNTKWFVDQLISGGDCGDLRIHRTWYVRDEKGREGVPVTQVIKFARPGLQDVYRPATTVAIECNQLTADQLDANGNPKPAVAGFPFIVSAFGIYDLNPSICNIGASYRELGTVDICENTRQIIREWTLVDWCAQNSNVLTHRQIIYVGDFTAPVVQQPADVVINTSPFSCSGTLQIAQLSITDNCASTILVSAKVFKKRREPILDRFGRPTGEFRDVLDLVYTGKEGDNVSGIELGYPYLVEYAVEDACGNQAAPVAYEVTVEDHVQPTMVCNDDLNISIGGDGLGRIHADDIDEGSADNCELKSLLISRKLASNAIRDAYLERILDLTFDQLVKVNQADPSGQVSEIWALKTNTGKQILRRKEGMWFTWWKEDQWFLCEDVGSNIRVELVAIDVFDNANICWLDVLIEDKVRPYCIAPPAQVLNCTDLPFAFDPQDNVQLATLFGNATGTDNCSATAAQVSKTVNWDCNAGTIIRYFQATDNQGLKSTNTCSQVITVNKVHHYEIKFPKDVTVECGVPMPDTVMFAEKACSDLLTVSVVDEPFTATDGECFKIRRIYKVINWCEYDTQADPVIVPRDADCDGVTGEEDVYVLVRPSGVTYIDRDNNENANPANSPCNNGAKGHYSNSAVSPALRSAGYWQYTQFIKINDTTAPQISATNGQVFCSISNNCTALVNIPVTVTDFCATDKVQSKVFLLPDPASGLPARIDLQIAANAASFNFSRTGVYPNFTLSGRFPLGDHQLEVVAEDGCLNSASRKISFKVVDCKAPAPICINGLSIELMRLEPGVDADGDGDEDAGAMSVMASDFQVSGLEDCTAPVTLSINRLGETPDRSQTSLVFTCDDLDTVLVEIYAWDSAFNPTAIQPDGRVGGPNYDHCQTYVLVQDNLFDLCGGGGGPAIAGAISTEEGNPVEKVKVNLTGGMESFVITGPDGMYSFDNLILGGDYTVTPGRNDNPLNGVNTLDLIHITKHILRTNPLDSPYKIIAADVDRSRTVTALDLIHLRKLLLTVYSEFPKSPSWRFLPADYVFPNPFNPFAGELPEVLNFNDLPSLIADGNFMAIKVGDVTGSAIASSQMTAPRTVVGNYNFVVEDRQVTVGNEYRVAFTAEDLEGLLGYQFTLDFDPLKLQLVDLEYGLAAAENFGLHRVEEGVITTSWNKENLELESADQALFTLVFRSMADGRLSDLLRLGSRYTPAEAYNTREETMQVALAFTDVSQVEDVFQLYQNQPNPWQDKTIIGFTLPAAEEGVFSLRDMQGRVIRIIRGHFDRGYNQIELDRATLPATGVFFYTLETGAYAATKKMVIVE